MFYFCVNVRGGRRQEAGSGRREVRRSWETGGGRQEAGGGRREAGGGRREAGGGRREVGWSWEVGWS